MLIGVYFIQCIDVFLKTYVQATARMAYIRQIMCYILGGRIRIYCGEFWGGLCTTKRIHQLTQTPNYTHKPQTTHTHTYKHKPTTHSHTYYTHTYRHKTNRKLTHTVSTVVYGQLYPVQFLSSLVKIPSLIQS